MIRLKLQRQTLTKAVAFLGNMINLALQLGQFSDKLIQLVTHKFEFTPKTDGTMAVKVCPSLGLQGIYKTSHCYRS